MTDKGREEELRVDGMTFVSARALDGYVYGIPEDAVPPATITRWLVAGDVTSSELRECLHTEALDAAGDSDEAQVALRGLVMRLEAEFPSE